MNLNRTDSFGRTVDYLRISITDRCNERCLYCLPENYADWLPRGEILAYDELLAIVRATTALGFKRFRVTGGEPLIRPGAVDFIRDLIATPGVESVLLTTNGTRLQELAKPLFDAGLRRINISLDALDPAIYRAITNGDVAPVLRGIKLVKELGFESVKLNTVLMRGKNDGEVFRLLDFAAEHDVAIRFIELMPVSLTEMLSEKNFFPVTELFAKLRREDEMEPLTESFGFGPAKYFRLKKRGVTMGLIGALSDLHFCERCNKMRLTCDGKLRPCLGNHLETDLKLALRPQIDAAYLHKLICETLVQKPSEHLFRENYQPQRVMTAIGG
ncbi:MAG TPA: GTP 3',8-cyclase MoaA [Methylomirabilota bacterium]|nr:GTP 3',8-cyclase MoaA [Methylomirabilota bacterium]